jgi:hypothetical protein
MKVISPDVDNSRAGSLAKEKVAPNARVKRKRKQMSLRMMLGRKSFIHGFFKG